MVTVAMTKCLSDILQMDVFTLQDSQNVTEEETNDTSSPPDTTNVTVAENTTVDDVVTPAQDNDDDPDSGDDTFSPITGFITENTTVDHHR